MLYKNSERFETWANWIGKTQIHFSGAGESYLFNDPKRISSCDHRAKPPKFIGANRSRCTERKIGAANNKGVVICKGTKPIGPPFVKITSPDFEALYP